VTSIILKLPISYLTNGGANPVIGGWTTASLRKVSVLADKPTFDRPIVTEGSWVQVSRSGNPLVNEVVIGLPDKDKFNASRPRDDVQFITYVTNPTLPAVVEILFGPAVKAPTLFPRTDLVATFLTGIEGVNKAATPCEYLRLNTTIAPTAAKDQKNLGVIAGDHAGFPNRRRPGDAAVRGSGGGRSNNPPGGKK